MELKKAWICTAALLERELKNHKSYRECNFSETQRYGRVKLSDHYIKYRSEKFTRVRERKITETQN